MEAMNIHMAGVGGQGIGLLSEVLLRAADHAGYVVKAVDTHGLAQRGGIVVSQLRLGSQVFTPLIPAGQADLVVALERHEALRAAQEALRPGGAVIYYDTVWQPLPVRLGEARQVTHQDLDAFCRRHRCRLIRVHVSDLEDARMQNIAVLAHIDKQGLIPGLERHHYLEAMEDLMAGSMLAANRAVFMELVENGGE